MAQLFEYIDSLNSPYEAFWVDSHNINDPTRPHWHYYMEIIYIEIGSLYVECEQQKTILQPGDFAIFHSKHIHTMEPLDKNSYRYGVIKFDISRLNINNSYTPKLRTLFDTAKQDPSAMIFFPAEKIAPHGFGNIFNTCIHELENKSYGYDMVVHASLCTLLIDLVRIWRENGMDTSHAAITSADGTSIDSITEYIDEHSSEPLLVEDLAARCSMSYSYFAKNFKQVYGRSCKEYIEFVRISKAEDLLLFTDFDLTYISQETGFSDCSHLIKIFKKWKGITPKQYKLRRASVTKQPIQAES